MASGKSVMYQKIPLRQVFFNIMQFSNECSAKVKHLFQFTKYIGLQCKTSVKERLRFGPKLDPPRNREIFVYLAVDDEYFTETVGFCRYSTFWAPKQGPGGLHMALEPIIAENSCSLRLYLRFLPRH